MCTTCGCGGESHEELHARGIPHEHGDEGHADGHGHTHGDGHGSAGATHASPFLRPGDADPSRSFDRLRRDRDGARRTVRLEHDVLAKNNALAHQLRAHFQKHRILALNLLSSPGAGKTTLLEWTVRALADERAIRVLEGDQETALDSDRIRRAGAQALQINTGTGCHLDAAMVRGGLEALSPPDGALLLIENVGNLVCPALFDLGEAAKVVVVSVTEGDDKPLKYPHIFRASDLMVLNKVDLLPHVPFSVERCVENALRVNPHLQVLPISALRGDGLDAWLAWLRQPLRSATAAHSAE